LFVRDGAQRAPSHTFQRIARIAAAAVLITFLGTAIAVPQAHAASGPKVAIIVGPNGSVTATNRANADAVAREALRYTSNVVKVYSPSATWSRVKAAMSGASIVIYFGRGFGHPSPHGSTLVGAVQNGFGLNPAAGRGNETTKYYGESYVRAANLKAGAVVVLLPVAYASGGSEPGRAAPTLAIARKRVDNYAAGFLAAGASAVLAETTKSIPTYYVRSIFARNVTLDAMWRGASTYHGHVTSVASSRTSGATVRTDPVRASSGFSRSFAGSPATTTATVRGSSSAITAKPPAPTPPAPVVKPASTKVIKVGSGQVGIRVTSSNTTLDGYQITGPQATRFNGAEVGIYVTGTPSAPLRNITIRNCQIQNFGNGGIVLQYVESFTIEDCKITDSVYAGIMVISGKNGVIRDNIILRTGVVGYETREMNSYGIAITDAGGDISSTIRILSNTVADVPQWHGIDTHGGRSIEISDNTVARTNRAIFITTTTGGRRPGNIVVNRNHLTQPTARADVRNTYPYNQVGVTLYLADSVTGTGNIFDSWPSGNHIGNTGSTNVSITGSKITNPR
jgi:parallel beta-helix repeat protein